MLLAMAGMAQTSSTAGSNFKTALSQCSTDTSGDLTNFGSTVLTPLSKVKKAFGQQMMAAFDRFTNNVVNGPDSIMKMTTVTLPKLLNQIDDEIGKVGSTIVSEFTDIGQKLGTSMRKLGKIIDDFAKDISTCAYGFIIIVIKIIKYISEAIEAVMGIFKALKKIAGLISSIIGLIAALAAIPFIIIAALIDELMNLISSIASVIIGFVMGLFACILMSIIKWLLALLGLACLMDFLKILKSLFKGK